MNIKTLGFLSLLAFGGAANATVAIVQGSFYTPDLKNALTGAGETVVEIANYTAASLTAYDSVIHYGNSYTDTTALTTYVNGGGNLILTPWSGLNFAVPAALQIFDNGGSPVYSQSHPGLNILDPANSLLTGVSLPTAPGGFNIGRITGIDFVAGVTQIVDWADGVGMLGSKNVGAGSVIGVNMHVITSDTAYQVINQAWATQLFANAVGVTQTVPAPATLALMGLGIAGISYRRRKQIKAA